MATPKIMSVALEVAFINAADVIEQLQDLDLEGALTLVDGSGAADRYELNQAIKRKNTVNFRGHWYNSSTELEATSLDITVYTLGGTSYLGEMQSGTFDFSNKPIETSGIAETDEYTQTTKSGVTVTTPLMLIEEAIWTQAIFSNTIAEMPVAVVFTFAGESIHIPGILSAVKQSIRNGEAQLEDVTIKLQGTPTTPGDTTSLVYLCLIGSALAGFYFDTGAGVYNTTFTGGPPPTATTYTQFAAITKFMLKFSKKTLVEQSLTLEVQGAMSASAEG